MLAYVTAGIKVWWERPLAVRAWRTGPLGKIRGMSDGESVGCWIVKDDLVGNLEDGLPVRIRWNKCDNGMIWRWR